MNAWRHKVARADRDRRRLLFRRAQVTGDQEPFNFHTTEAALDYRSRPTWSLSGGAGIVYLRANLAARCTNRPGLSRRARAAPRRHHVPRRLPAHLHPVVRLRRHGPEPGRRRRLPDPAVPRPPLLSRRVGGVPRQPAADRQRVIVDPITGASSSCRCARCGRTPILGWEPQPLGPARSVLCAGSADQPPRRRLSRSQSRRIPDRDFQAYEDGVMDEPRFDPLDYVSVVQPPQVVVHRADGARR